MSQGETIRVAFVLPGDLWIGGRNYLRNLFAAIQTLPGQPILPIIFTGFSTDMVKADIPNVEVVRTKLLDRKKFPWMVRKVIAKAFGQDIILRQLLERHKIAVLSHHIYLGKQKSIATISWIADFQHLYLPELCTAEEIEKRERDYHSLCKCDQVIVSSENALSDLKGFSPITASKGALLRFVASPAPLTNATSLPELQQTYGFEGPYFLLPNQFWAHKNHQVVIDALAILKHQQRPLLVLSTGATIDYRAPTFFPELEKYVEAKEVTDSFRVLGQIPYDHLLGLMRSTTAFINPSRFEGWSTSVEEAKSIGKQIVLSNIPVHLEQAPPRAFYFPPDDPEALVKAMQQAHESYNPSQDAAYQHVAEEDFRERQRQFGLEYYQIVTNALSRKESVA